MGMKLIKAKVAGHHVVKNSGWFSLNKKLTILAGPDGSGKTTILKSLLTINPVEVQEQFYTLSDYPDHFFTKGYRRQINPSKKTIAFGVFTCSRKLLYRLGAIDPVLFETDRIEVGRRLDLSRWITFVEIATSTRWSEIAEDFYSFRDFLTSQTGTQELSDRFDLIKALKKTDRIKGEAAEKLNSLLKDAEKFIDAKHRSLFDSIHFGVNRSERFKNARQDVSENLPFFYYFSGSQLLQTEFDLTNQENLNSDILSYLGPKTAANPELSSGNTILLLDEPDINLDGEAITQMQKAIDQLSQLYQIIMTTKSIDFIRAGESVHNVQLLQQDDESGTIVEPAATFDQISALLEK